jgi:hypothetical protein
MLLMKSSNHRKLHAGLDGHALAAWLNLRRKGIAPAQAAVAAYLRFENSGRKGAFPDAARLLFTRPAQGRLRHCLGSLDFAPFGDLDDAIFRLRDLSQAGKLTRMRECPECLKWFFAENLKQLFCSDNCRVKAWQKKPAGRKARADYMRRYRETLKKRLEKSGDLIRLRRGRKVHIDLKKGD